MDVDSPNPAEEWATLTRRSLLRDADALRLHLESNGITVFVPDEYTATANFLLVNAMNGVRLQVPKAELRQAHALMKEWEASLLLVSAQCPACHSHHVAYAPDKRNPLLIALSMIFWIFQSDDVSLECRDCKHTWKAKKESLDKSAESMEVN